MDAIIALAKDNWAVIGPAVWQFVTLGVVALALGWTAGRFAFGERIETLKSRVENRDEKLADYKEKLGGKAPDEAAARIAALEANLRRLQPLMLEDDKVLAVIQTLSVTKGTIRINRDNDDSNVEPAYRQMVDIFDRAGWKTEDLGAVLGQVGKPPCGRQLILRADMDQMQVSVIRKAFSYAGVAVDEMIRLEQANVKVPQLVFSAPYQPARWS